MRTGPWLGLALLFAGCTGFSGADVDLTDDASGSSGSVSATAASSDPTVASAPATESSTESATESGTGSGGSATAGQTSSASDDAGDPTSGPSSTSDPTETTSGPSSTTGAAESSGDSSSSASSSSSSSSSSTGDMGDALLGTACSNDEECDVGADQECCTDSHCIDTCMVPCSDVEECPVEGMGCEHGYCLFPCNDNDDDCAEWPGYTCEHGGTLCEIP